MTQMWKTAVEYWKLIADWIAACLAAGSAMGIVNFLVGLMSAAWLATQIWIAWKYRIPAMKRASAKDVKELGGDE